MTDKQIEALFITGIRIGTIATIKRFGLSSEQVTLKEAYKLYSRQSVENWRKKGWITFYSTGGAKNSKFFCKRSELEMASAMMDFGNISTQNRIHKIIME